MLHNSDSNVFDLILHCVSVLKIENCAVKYRWLRIIIPLYHTQNILIWLDSLI